MSYLQSTIGSLRLFSSTKVDAAVGNPVQDETHYFLIPQPTGGETTLSSTHTLPRGRVIWWVEADYPGNCPPKPSRRSDFVASVSRFCSLAQPGSSFWRRS